MDQQIATRLPTHAARLRACYGVTVVAVKSQAEGTAASFTDATPDTVLMCGDVILVVGGMRDVERFAETD